MKLKFLALVLLFIATPYITATKRRKRKRTKAKLRFVLNDYRSKSTKEALKWTDDSLYGYYKNQTSVLEPK